MIGLVIAKFAPHFERRIKNEFDPRYLRRRKMRRARMARKRLRGWA